MHIDPTEYEKRRSRIEEIFSGIVQHADKQALMRCPYKDRHNCCTAKFGCRNKRKARAAGELPACTSDDQLDYRDAWEVNPEHVEPMRQALRAPSAKRNRKEEADSMAASPCGTVSHDAQGRAAVAGRTIFDYADELAVRVPTSCGRTGHCHECIVEIKAGMDALCPRTEAEAFLADNYRLACQAQVIDVEGDVVFALPRRAPRILTEQTRRVIDLEPMVARRGDKVCYGDEVIDEYRGRLLGMAIDLGTTTVVAELVDLETADALVQTSFENPQRFGGSDVMRRISYDAGAYRGELHLAIKNALNSEIRQMCADLEIQRTQIYEILVVGNATMRELFFGLDVQSIGTRPYKSSVEHDVLEGRRDTTSLTESARRLGLYANRNARVFGAPLIASHVGGDVTADLVAVDMAHRSELVMLVDAGTNTEVVIGNRDRIMAASCPAGPAFEGGLVTCGMPGYPGAIESVRYDPEHRCFDCGVIGGAAPLGMCGSGLIDLLAELRRHELMTPKGVFADKATEVAIVPEHGITLSRRDASELAQAKAANTCGQMILMRNYGVRPDEIDKLFLAGGFANYVNAASAVEIGFLAPVPHERVVKVGNAAAQGAREMLLSKRKRADIEALVKRIEHVELETMSDFFEVFVDGCQFKPMVFAE
jgi:uncharacterized 2Fe-2S/4Fe-4S cluster protein (DUF4445 family)